MRLLRWSYKGVNHRSAILDLPCTQCGERAVVKLPAAILLEQPDETTHVCHPSAGGCNQGFALDEPPIPFRLVGS